jgi:hypothetical protein
MHHESVLKVYGLWLVGHCDTAALLLLLLVNGELLRFLEQGAEGSLAFSLGKHELNFKLYTL